MTDTIQEIRLCGSPISEGIAIGSLYILESDEEWSFPEFSIDPSQVEQEIARYRRALACSCQELKKLMACLESEGATDAISILEAHLLMLDDPVITSDVEKKIESDLKNTESVFVKEMESYGAMLKTSNDVNIRQRYLDIKDLLTRVLRHLHPSATMSSQDIPSHSIVCAKELVPSQTAEASPNQVRAFITEFGGPTSHAALIAKSKGVPYISNVDIDELKRHGTAEVIVDGCQGIVILNPSDETLKEYTQIRATRLALFESQKEEFEEVDTTLDQQVIEVQANLEDLHDLHYLKELRTKTIGLVRSEFLYLKSDVESFCENEQYELYKKLMQLSGNMEVTFRIFDIGSDKRFMRQTTEPNPALGCRSIRFLIDHPKVFTTQIRAVLRAALFGKMKLLLPLISDLEELREAKAFIENVKEQLREEGIDHCHDIEIGCMVEVPAFVIMCDQLAKECDFLSIGTNDLAQYTFAADRSNPRTCEKYSYEHPALVRMIKRVVEEGKRAGVDVSVCGEIASDPSQTELLIGLGVTKLSCAPRFIPAIKQSIKRIDSTLASEKAASKYGLD